MNKAIGFPDACEDCEGSRTTIVNVEGISKRRDHACGCRDWSYAREKNVWYRLKWCTYHGDERIAQMKAEDKQKEVSR